jgi:PAS domain S-box-containing protein
MLSAKSLFKLKMFVLLTIFLFISLVATQIQAETEVNTKSSATQITVVVVKNFPPHYSLNKNGEPQGFAIDIIEQLAENSGLKLNYIIKDNWVDTAIALKNGEADLIPNLGITKIRQQDFDFTNPVEIYPISIITRTETNNIKSKTDLSGKTVGVVKFNVGGKIVKSLSNVTTITYEQPENALIALLSGQVDAVVYPQSVMLKIARESRLERYIKIAGKPLKEIRRAIAIQKGNSKLLEKLNNSINTFLLSPQYENIYNKWYGKPSPFWNTFRILIASGITLLLTIFILTIWRYFTISEINKRLLLFVSERDLANKNLAASETQLRTLIATLPDLIWLKDPDGVYLSCNPKFENLFGEKKYNIVGKTDYDFVDKELADSFRKNDRAAMLAGTPIVNEEELTFANDGHTEFVETIKTTMLNSEGELIGVLGIARDITERKLAGKALEESKLLLENVLNSSPDLIFAKNTKLQTILANKAYASAIGKKPQEMIGFTDIENGWDPELVKGNPDKGIRGFEHDDKDALAGIAVHNPHDPANVKGEIRIFDTHKLPLRDSQGNIIGILGMARDTTERLQAEEKIKHQQQELQQILDSMIDAVIGIDEIGTIESFNKTAENLFGYDTNDIVGKNIKLLMPQHYAKQHDNYLQNYYKSDKALTIGISRDVEGKHKNNSTFPIRLSISELPKDTDGTRHFIGTCHDLTKQNLQEEQLRRSQKMDALGKLTGGIAHDYNNMLGVISGYADLLKDAVSEQPKLLKYTNEIYRAAERGAKLTKKLLVFSRSKSGDPEIVNINALLQNEQHMLEKTLTARIKLIFDLNENPWQVWLDSNDLTDAILNICINSMHAIKSNGQITIKTFNQQISPVDAQALHLEAGDYIILRITDTGSGMDDQVKQRIFDPFFSTKAGKGTGLGLSQVYGFVERSGGTIKVYSELDHGTEILLYFPHYKNNKSDTKHVTENILHSSFDGNETILVVDDEPALLELITNILELKGYTVIPAESGAKALDILKNNSIDLLLSDVIMPDMDGYQLSTIVQKEYPDVKIQLASGFSDNRHLDMIDKSLHENLLYKPYHADSLYVKIRALLDS